jgi:microcystin-dependent protein
MAYSSAPANTTLAAPAAINTGVAGSSIPLANMPPLVAVSFIIATQGIFPSRN